MKNVSIQFFGKPYGFRCPFFEGSGKENALKSKTQIVKELGLEEEKLIFLNQRHSDICIDIHEHNFRDTHAADASLSQMQDIVLCVLTSDCLPIAVFDQVRGIIGVIHAGNKGLENKIITKTLSKMKQEYGSELKDIQIYIGPHISKEYYEVGSEFIDRFGNALIQRNEKYFLDLSTLAKRELYEFGIGNENIEVSPRCTYQDISLHSYRRNTHNPEEEYANNCMCVWISGKN